MPDKPLPLSRQIVGIGVSAIVKHDGTLKALESIRGKAKARDLLGKWADTYLAYIHARHRAAGNGAWQKTQPQTIKARKNAKVRIPSRSVRTMIDTQQLLMTSKKGGRGQERKLDVQKLEVRAGIDGHTRYLDPRRNRLGYKHERLKRTMALADLARFHASADPRRTVVVRPDPTTYKELRLAATAWVKENMSS
jgi:hypothetical protein